MGCKFSAENDTLETACLSEQDINIIQKIQELSLQAHNSPSETELEFLKQTFRNLQVVESARRQE